MNLGHSDEGIDLIRGKMLLRIKKLGNREMWSLATVMKGLILIIGKLLMIKKKMIHLG